MRFYKPKILHSYFGNLAWVLELPTEIKLVFSKSCLCNSLFKQIATLVLAEQNTIRRMDILSANLQFIKKVVLFV